MSNHILLIEPDSLTASHIQEHLRVRGFSVVWKNNAQDAISAADTRMPNLIIMEMLLAAHSGVEFLYELRSYTEWQKVPVIIFSHLRLDTLNLTTKSLDKLGVSAYLYKPETSLRRLGQRVSIVMSSATS